MITIYCALYQEAQALIHNYKLKKENGQHHFQVFSDSGQTIRLVITGVGEIAAATAVAEISTHYPVSSSDFLLNYGCCAAAGEEKKGELYLCNRLMDKMTGRIYYPDILYCHPLQEEALLTVASVLEENEVGSRIYDMEAAAVYQAGNYYYAPDQMHFLKVVSDCGSSSVERVQAEELKGILDAVAQKVCGYIDRLQEIAAALEESRKYTVGIRERTREEAIMLGEELRASQTMQAELFQLLLYWKLSGFAYRELIMEYRSREQIPVKEKREGKRILDELKRKL